jgi:dipeptidyl aminopeptidase/acylaminoacyl peptidase
MASEGVLMTSDVRQALLACSVSLLASVAVAAPLPVESFARMPQMRDVVISPDGRYVAFISSMGDISTVMTFDRQANTPFKRIAASEPGRFDVSHCQWANNDRLACTLVGNIRGRNYAELPFVRMMAVDVDGAKIKTLDVLSEKGNLHVGKTTPQNFNAGVSQRTGSSPAESQDYTQKTYGEKSGRTFENFAGQRSDQIIDISPNEPDTVLIQTDDDGNKFPSVFTLNVYNGMRNVRVRQNPPIRNFITDGTGEVRLGWGRTTRLVTHYFARTAGDKWQALEKVDAFAQNRQLLPIGVARGKNIAYAIGENAGRTSLWTFDLDDQGVPEVVFSLPQVDLGGPLLTNDRRLMGIRYDLDRPAVYYNDESLRKTLEGINAQYAPRFNMAIDMTSDEKTLVLRSTSDVDAGTYYLFNKDEKKLKRLGVAYPELNQESLGTMKHITYKAADGSEVPGYLTVPNGVAAEKLPLVVLPHDGPAARDVWQFSYLRNFLANRGYAVLQMNYRGSAGYGQKWRADAKQDWGGVTYSDIADATRWAVAEGIADPKRICIAGSGFGGYAALLGAARNSDLYKCSISLGGFSDLEMLRDNAALLGRSEEAYMLDQIGSDGAKLTLHSPAQQAAGIAIPVLLIHGDMDWQVQIDQSKRMESALKKNRKDHKAVYIKGAGHEFERKSDRMIVLKEVEEFLQKNLGAGAQPAAAKTS